MTLTLNTAKQPFHKTLQLMNMHCQTKPPPPPPPHQKKKEEKKKKSSSEHIIEIVIFDCMNQNSVTVTLTLKIETRFSHMMLWLIMMSPILGLVTNGSVVHKIICKLTLTEIFNLGCDIDLEHSNPTFSLDTSLLMMIYTEIEFGWKRLTGLELIKDIVETVVFWLYKPSPWPWR